MGFKSYFIFSRQQRNGIFLLVFLIVLSLGVYFFVDFNPEDLLDISSPEIVSRQKQLDSLRFVNEKKNSAASSFNPNFISDFSGYMMGLSNEEIDRLHEFRSQGKWINSPDEFQQVTKISDSLLEVLKPRFRFPEWVQNRKPDENTAARKREEGGFTEKPYDEKTDLNQATAEELQKVNGVGEVLSARIISYRDKSGGFSDDRQLYEVYGLKPEVVSRILNLFTVKTTRKIEKINVNTASASDLATVPGVSFDLARKIWEYQRLREGIDSIGELKKVEGMTERTFIQIQLYLSAD